MREDRREESGIGRGQVEGAGEKPGIVLLPHPSAESGDQHGFVVSYFTFVVISRQ